MILTAEEIFDLAQMVGFSVDREGVEMDQEFAIEDCPDVGVLSDDNVVQHYAHIAYDVEYPEEGVMPLGAEITKDDKTRCKECGKPWIDHEFAVPAPCCP